MPNFVSKNCHPFIFSQIIKEMRVEENSLSIGRCCWASGQQQELVQDSLQACPINGLHAKSFIRSSVQSCKYSFRPFMLRRRVKLTCFSFISDILSPQRIILFFQIDVLRMLHQCYEKIVLPSESITNVMS